MKTGQKKGRGLMRAFRGIAGAMVGVVALGVSACGSQADTGASRSPSPAPTAPLSIAVPPTADDTAVEVEVRGTPGTEASVYAYGGGWGDTAPACTASVEPLQNVTVRAEPVRVKVSVPHAGRWWWVVGATTDAGGVASQCDAANTLVRSTARLALAGPRPVDGLSGYTKKVPAGKAFPYYVLADTDAPSPLEGGWPVEVEWIGPYQSAPEAKAAPCDSSQPVALTSKGTASLDKPAKISTTPTRQGVYRLVANTRPTTWTSGGGSGCDDSTPYLTVGQ